jgi:hypothetical protein
VLISLILRATITVTTMFRYIVQSEILEVYIFQVAAFLHLFEYVKKHLPNRHTKVFLSNQLTETTYTSIVLSMSSHIIIPACCKLAHLIIKKFLIIRSTSLANHITENLQHKWQSFSTSCKFVVEHCN